jgi:hypothetical protein
MPKHSEDIYGTHKFMNQSHFSKPLARALRHTNAELGTTATLQQVKCAISRGLVVRANNYCIDNAQVKDSIAAGLDTMLRPLSLAAAFGWHEVSVPWHNNSSEWWCNLSQKLYNQCDHHRRSTTGVF